MCCFTFLPNCGENCVYQILMDDGGGMQIARFNSYALLFLKVEKISIQNYTFLESLLYQESTI